MLQKKDDAHLKAMNEIQELMKNPEVTGRGVTIYATPVTKARAKLKPFSLDCFTNSLVLLVLSRMRSNPTGVTESLGLAFKLSPIRSIQPDSRYIQLDLMCRRTCLSKDIA